MVQNTTLEPKDGKYLQSYVSKAGFKVSIQKKRAALGNTLKVIFTNNMLHYREKKGQVMP